MRRNPTLDFLRFIAIVLVLFRHVELFGHGIVTQTLTVLSAGGWVGVDLFFVLSGFLVSGLIFKEYEDTGAFRPGRFLLRRGFKIYPTFYLFLGLTFLSTYYFHLASPESNLKYLYEALFICNYTQLPPHHSWLWSICVEEHFYFLLCLLLVILIFYRKVSYKAFLAIYLTLLVTGIGLRLYSCLHYATYDFYRDFTRSHVRFDGLFFGVLLSYMSRTGRLTWRGWRSPWVLVLAVAGVVLPFLFSFDDPNNMKWETVLLLATNPICFGYLMIRILAIRAAAWMRPFAFIGKYSYSIYLFHGFLNGLCYAHLSGIKYYIVYFTSALVIGVLISKIVEYPMLAIRDKWFPAEDKATRLSRVPSPA